MLKLIAIILGIAAFAGVATAEPSARPGSERQVFKSPFPIGGVAGGLIPISPRVP